MLNIGGVEIGAGAPVACIAEIGNAHNGDYNRAVRLLDAAKAAGASAAKLQCYSVDELISLRGDGPAPAQWGEQGMSMRDLYSRAMTPREWFPSLYEHAASIGLPVFSSFFGMESLELLESVGNSCYKLSKFESGNADLIRAAKATGKPVLASVGQMFSLYTQRACDGLLYCPGSYPCSIRDVHLGLFPQNDRFLGLSLHCLDPSLAVAAVARGAVILEYHFQLDGEPSQLEANVSLAASEFAAMVRDVRHVEAVLA